MTESTRVWTGSTLRGAQSLNSSVVYVKGEGNENLSNVCKQHTSGTRQSFVNWLYGNNKLAEHDDIINTLLGAL